MRRPRFKPSLFVERTVWSKILYSLPNATQHHANNLDPRYHVKIAGMKLKDENDQGCVDLHIVTFELLPYLWDSNVRWAWRQETDLCIVLMDNPLPLFKPHKTGGAVNGQQMDKI